MSISAEKSTYRWFQPSNRQSDDDLKLKKSTDDAPVALSFQEQARQRSKTEEATRASVQALKKRAKEARRAKLESKTRNVAEPLEDALQLPESIVESNEEEEEESSEPLTKKGKFKDCDEFHLADTFDFRQYLPKEMLEEDKEEEDEQVGSDDEADFEEEEMSRAIMEGYIDSDEGYHGSDEQRPVKKGKKAKLDKAKATVDSQETKPANRRGGRRVRKKHSAVPRVVILDRTGTEAVRARTDAFVTERLFSPDAKGPFIRRMKPTTLEALSAKKRIPFKKK
ncbi:unnamed protein product [Dibothriocephalus latus]|uniref:Uncharacterized protein n=1 Tax=Dibothriocephalus latus TaxID=60516 RepID=A0A3P7LBD2_DIBLA|nr:unnamed protein product [Dibothriocephalus latus]